MTFQGVVRAAFAKEPTQEEAELGPEQVVFRPPFVGARVRAGISSFLDLGGRLICEMLLAKSFHMVGKKTGQISVSLDLLRGLGPEAPLQKAHDDLRIDNMRDYRLNALQMQAALVGCADVVEWTRQRGARGVFNRIPKIDAGSPSYDGASALLWAAEKGHNDCLNSLLTAGARLDAKNRNGKTALLWAAEKGHTDCLNSLLAAGADVHAEDSEGNTALHLAALNGHVSCVGPLHHHGARLDAKNKNGKTAFTWAAEKGHTDCLDFLLTAGAEFNFTATSNRQSSERTRRI